jgi:hypothetical protein
MLWKIHGTNFFNIKFLNRSNIKCQNRPVLPPAQVFYFNGQALHVNLPLVSLYLLKKPHLNVFGSFKNLSIHRDRKREVTLFYTML